MSPVFIYALLDPVTLETRYVGQTVDPDTRLYNHLKRSNKNKYHSAYWICSLHEEGLTPLMEILDVVPDTEADFWEREYIQNFRERGFRLTNFSDGGSAPMRGKKHSPENRAKIGRPSPKRGKKLSAEIRAKMSISHLGNKSNLGKKHTPEVRAKIQAAMLGRKVSPETRAKMSAARKRRKISDEQRIKMRANAQKQVRTRNSFGQYA